jgi:hypothetical protein
MSQQSVEQVIGKLATDQDLRQMFAVRGEATLHELIATGLSLTPVEIRALVVLDLGALQRLADGLDSRIQKVGRFKNSS